MLSTWIIYPIYLGILIFSSWKLGILVNGIAITFLVLNSIDFFLVLILIIRQRKDKTSPDWFIISITFICLLQAAKKLSFDTVWFISTLWADSSTFSGALGIIAAILWCVQITYALFFSYIIIEFCRTTQLEHAPVRSSVGSSSLDDTEGSQVALN